MIRSAQPDDLPALLALGGAGLSRRSPVARQFRRFMRSDTSHLLVDEQQEQLAGYALLLVHHRTHLARLYSLAVNPHLPTRYRPQPVTSLRALALEQAI